MSASGIVSVPTATCYRLTSLLRPIPIILYPIDGTPIDMQLGRQKLATNWGFDGYTGAQKIYLWCGRHCWLTPYFSTVLGRCACQVSRSRTRIDTLLWRILFSKSNINDL